MVYTFSMWYAAIFGVRLSLASNKPVNEPLYLYAFTDSGSFKMALPYLMAVIPTSGVTKADSCLYKYHRWVGISFISILAL